jgi:hypothetical protein
VTYDFASQRITELCSPEFTASDEMYSQTDCFQVRILQKRHFGRKRFG